MIRARLLRTFIPWTAIARVVIIASALFVACQFAIVSPAAATVTRFGSAPPATATFVNLRTAASYSILAGTGVANTGAGTVLAGDLGLSPDGLIAGFPPGTVTGTIHDKDSAADTAQGDRATAYTAAAAETSSATISGDQAGTTFHPGVYTSAAALTNTGTITLDANGDSSGVFVFQIGAALSSAAASKVVLTNGALANNSGRSRERSHSARAPSSSGPSSEPVPSPSAMARRSRAAR